MYKSRGVISIVLVFCILFSLTVSVYAMEPDVDDLNIEGNQSSEERKDQMRFENVSVKEIFDFSEEAIISIENCVIKNDKGLFYVSNEEKLKSVLTNEEYLIVLQQIDISNNRAITAMLAGNGSESSPYILTANVAFWTSATGASSTWFQISNILGATDFIVSTSQSAYVVIYKTTLLGKTQIDSASGFSIHKVVSHSGTNSGANSYIINVQVNATMTSSMTVRQHADSSTTYYSGGTIWTPGNLSAIPYPTLLTQKQWYLKPPEVDDLSTFINNNNYIQYVDAFFAGTMTAASIAVAIWGLAGGGDAATVVGIALTLISASSAGVFRQHIKNSLNTAGGWNGTAFTQPVYLKHMFDVYTTTTIYNVYSWDGVTMYGDAGYTGAFSAYSNT